MTVGDAVLALVEAAVPGVTVYDAHVPSSTATSPLPGRYVVVYPTTPQLSAEGLCASDTVRAEWQVTSVGATRPEAQWLAEHVRDGLVDRRPTVPGMTCAPIEHTGSQPVRWDDQVAGRVVLYATDQYGFDATLA